MQYITDRFILNFTLFIFKEYTDQGIGSETESDN
jgi:hypothetical protein